MHTFSGSGMHSGMHHFFPLDQKTPVPTLQVDQHFFPKFGMHRDALGEKRNKPGDWVPPALFRPAWGLSQHCRTVSASNRGEPHAKVRAMKKAIPLLLVLSSIQFALGNSRYVTLTNHNRIETVLATDLVEIVGLGSTNTPVQFTRPDGNTLLVEFSGISRDPTRLGSVYTGMTQVEATGGGTQILTLKITPAATTVTTSKPVMVPPTSASDNKVNVQLQVSTDLKNWEDVAPGEFLGSETARFFRVKATSGSPE